MIEHHHYSCGVVWGNIAWIEYKQQTDCLRSFLNSFGIDSSIVPVVSRGKEQSDSVDFVFGDFSLLRVLRFAEAIRAFCLFHQMTLVEFDLS